MIGWGQPRQVVKIVNWCGHSQDFVAWLGRTATGGWCRSWEARDGRLRADDSPEHTGMQLATLRSN